MARAAHCSSRPLAKTSLVMYWLRGQLTHPHGAVGAGQYAAYRDAPD
jgi:hypothetical protein